MAEKMFGNKATLASRPNARLGDNANPVVVNQVFDEVWARSMVTIDRWASESDGSGRQPQKLKEPYFRIRVDDTGLYIDLIGELVPANDALEWFANSFNITGYKTNLRRAIGESAQMWARKEYGKALIATATGVREGQF